MPPKIRKCLGDDSDTYSQFIGVLLVCFCGANCVGLVDGAQALLDNPGRDDEIAARFVIERLICCTADCVQASGHADEGAGATFLSLQKRFVIPIRLCAAANVSIAGIDVNQTATDATN